MFLVSRKAQPWGEVGRMCPGQLLTVEEGGQLLNSLPAWPLLDVLNKPGGYVCTKSSTDGKNILSTASTSVVVSPIIICKYFWCIYA